MGNATSGPKRKPNQKNRELDVYYSTFLKDLASHKSDVSQYLDTMLYHKKRRSTNLDQMPKKIVKLSRRQKKRLKNENSHLKSCVLSETKNTRGSFNAIERTDLFYCANNINTKRDKLVLRLPKERMY